jgi:hypothetical protein
MRTSVAIGAATFLNCYAEFRVTGANRSSEIFVEYYQSNGTFISSTTVAGSTITSGAWIRNTTGALTTPALTARADVTYRITSAATGESLLIDSAFIQGTASTGVAYYDGDTDSFSGWSGQVGNSVSHRSSYDDSFATTHDTAGTVVSGELMKTGGTTRLFEFPKDIHPEYNSSFGATPQDRLSASPILPTELNLIFTGSPTSSTGARLIAPKAYLTG